MSATKGIKRVQGKRGDAQVQLRLPGDLRGRIKSVAQGHGHSMNTAIVMALEEAFPAPMVPESVNEALMQAATEIASQWANLLSAMGQNPDENAALLAINASLEAAGSKSAGIGRGE